jgi:trk system potassium uptake protein TrkH
MDWRSVASYTGTLLEILGILILVPALISWIYSDGLYPAFFAAAIISFIAGTLLDKRFQKAELTISSAMVISALVFLLASVIGCIPFLFYAAPLDAFFEASSGFTTTGLTVVNPELLPESLLFWRAMTQWIGGIGIILIFILLVASPGISASYLYKAEGRTERIEPGIKNTVRKMFVIYGIYTFAGVLLLTAAGMPVFHSVMNTFTSLSTGGFTPTNLSIAAYNNVFIEAILIIMMVLGATSFFIHDMILRKKFRDVLNNPEVRLFWTLIVLFILLLILSMLTFPEALRYSVFYAFSALTTTGMTNSVVPAAGLTKLLLLLMMVIGGYAGSTAGGIKLIRAAVIGKSIPWIGKKISLPEEAVVPFKLGNRVFKNSELSVISLYVSIYLVVLGASSVGLTILGYSPVDSIFQAASAEGTVGLSVIDTASMHPAGKLILIFNMFIGRLEIFPYMVLVYVVYRAAAHRLRERGHEKRD